MAQPFTLKHPTTPGDLGNTHYLKDPTPDAPGGSTGPGSGAGGPELTVLGVPLAVRLVTDRSDMHVSAEVDGLTFRSEIPGGYSECEMKLNRPLRLDPDEIRAFGDVIVYDGRHGGTVWQGRLEDPGRASGANGEIWTLRATGPSAHARDRHLALIYIDSNWREWRAAQINDVAGENQLMVDPGGSGEPSLYLKLPKGLDIGITSFFGLESGLLAETEQKLARFAFSWDAGISTSDYRISILIGPDGGSIAEVSSINFSTAGGTNADVITTDFANPSDTVRVTINPAGGVDPTTDTVWCSIFSMRLMATLYAADGTEDTAGASYTTNYYLAHQIVADLLGRVLTEYDGDNASIATNTYQITQLAYPDGATPADVLDDLMRLEPEYYWAVWEDSYFEWAQWPESGGSPVIRYEARAEGGFDSPGSRSEVYNAVIVRWRDAIGRTRRTRVTSTVAELDAAGITREALVDLGDEIGSSENATQVGTQYLAEHKYAPNAGRLKVQKPIPDFTLGRMVQPWEIRPGGHIRVLDVKPRPDVLNPTERDGVTVFRVTGVAYNASDNSATLELDSQPRTLEGLLRRTLAAPEKRRR